MRGVSPQCAYECVEFDAQVDEKPYRIKDTCMVVASLLDVAGNLPNSHY